MVLLPTHIVLTNWLAWLIQRWLFALDSATSTDFVDIGSDAGTASVDSGLADDFNSDFSSDSGSDEAGDDFMSDISD